jgi:hypothetical protein
MHESNAFCVHCHNARLLGRIKLWEMLQKMGDWNFTNWTYNIILLILSKKQLLNWRHVQHRSKRKEMLATFWFMEATRKLRRQQWDTNKTCMKIIAKCEMTCLRLGSSRRFLTNTVIDFLVKFKQMSHFYLLPFRLWRQTSWNSIIHMEILIKIIFTFIYHEVVLLVCVCVRACARVCVCVCVCVWERERERKRDICVSLTQLMYCGNNLYLKLSLSQWMWIQHSVSYVSNTMVGTIKTFFHSYVLNVLYCYVYLTTCFGF